MVKHIYDKHKDQNISFRECVELTIQQLVSYHGNKDYVDQDFFQIEYDNEGVNKLSGQYKHLLT